MNKLLLISFFVFFQVSALLAQTPDTSLTRSLKDYVMKNNEEISKKGKLILGVMRVPDAQMVYSQGLENPVHMASIQKLLITYASLKVLGSEYTIPTEFFTDYLPEDRDPRLDFSAGIVEKKDIPDNSLGNLYVRTYGNPVLQYEDLQLMVRELKARGLNGVNDLIVDDTLFMEDSPPAGTDAYQAGQSAASLEFNTYRIIVSPTSSGERAFISGSPGLFGEVLNKTRTLSGKGISLDLTQSPSNDNFLRFTDIGKFKPRPVNIHVSGRIGLGDDVWEKYHAHPDPFSYFILSLKKALESEGVKVGGELFRKPVPSKSKPIYTHESEPLKFILSKLNNFSNNFIANQLLYLIGQDRNGLFSKKKGLEVLKDLLVEEDLWTDSMQIEDASGLSNENRIVPDKILSLLLSVDKDFSIKPIFVSSLSRLGISGTAKDRSLVKDSEKEVKYYNEKSRIDGVWVKTGTVNGVSGISGFLERSMGFRLAFFVLLEGDFEKSRAIEIENDIIRILVDI